MQQSSIRRPDMNQVLQLLKGEQGAWEFAMKNCRMGSSLKKRYVGFLVQLSMLLSNQTVVVLFFQNRLILITKVCAMLLLHKVIVGLERSYLVVFVCYDGIGGRNEMIHSIGIIKTLLVITLRFVLDGEMSDYLLAKDLILQIIGEISISGATYKAMEFVGSTIESLSGLLEKDWLVLGHLFW